MNVDIQSSARYYPSLPYEKMKDVILGKQYSLSLVFHGETNARKINKMLRKKTYAANVLSVPLDSNHGEIFITPQVAKREAKKFGHSTASHIGFLFIHGLLHLKGYDHGKKMDALEAQYMNAFKLTRYRTETSA